MAQIEVISGVDRRRRWTLEDKRIHVARAFEPGVIVKAYARQHDVPTSALYVWRNQLRREGSGFTPVVVKADAVTDPCSRQDVIEVALSNGTQLRIPSTTPAELAAFVIKALVRQ
jgi:transposase